MFWVFAGVKLVGCLAVTVSLKVLTIVLLASELFSFHRKDSVDSKVSKKHSDEAKRERLASNEPVKLCCHTECDDFVL